MSESVIDFRVDDQEIVKVDAIGTGAFIAMPHKEIGVLLDLEGMTNRPPSLEGVSDTLREPVGSVHNGCLHCPPKPGTLPLDYPVHPGFGLLNLTCDDETPEWFGQFMDWGYWVREDGSRAVSPNSRILGWRATMRDDMRWETPDERLVLGDIEEAVAEDPDHDWRLRIEGPMVGVVYQRHGRGRWVAVERLKGFA